MLPEDDMESQAALGHFLHGRHVVGVARHECDLVVLWIHPFIRIGHDVSDDAAVDFLFLVPDVPLVDDDLESLVLGRPPERVIGGRARPVEDGPTAVMSLNTIPGSGNPGMSRIFRASRLRKRPWVATVA